MPVEIYSHQDTQGGDELLLGHDDEVVFLEINGHRTKLTRVEAMRLAARIKDLPDSRHP